MQVSPAERAVELGGRREELQPRVMQVLVALAKSRPAVVSRDRLVDQCWDGRIVGDDALNRCILALRHLAQQFTPPPFVIETVPRIGHRLVEPEAARDPAHSFKGNRRTLFVATLALLLLAAAGVFVWQQRREAAEPASIAVLPFRNLGTGDPHFAEGIGEEILGQLAREPHFRVAGSSSSSQFGVNPDATEVGARLDVDYVLEGSVRRQDSQVRVNAGLVRASDGMRLWSETYDGKLDDIFAIQQQIGAAIAGALQRKLLRTQPLSGPLVTRGEAYTYYLTARGLIRTRHRQMGPTAMGLLREAISIDPGYAPAWASLAEATQLDGGLGDKEKSAASHLQARRYARHAVSLAPNLAEGHRALGQTYGFGTPESEFHLRRAAQLDPNNAENLIALADSLAATAEFEKQLDTYRQAQQVDPLWYRPIGALGIALAERGDKAQAAELARRRFPKTSPQQNILLGRIAWIHGDFSEAYRLWRLIVRSGSPRWSERAGLNMHDALVAVGLEKRPPRTIPQPIWARRSWSVWMAEAPTPAVWKSRNRDEIHSEVYRSDNLVAAKLMLDAGRTAELVSTYRGRIGLMGIRPGVRVRPHQIDAVPIVALALRQAGLRAQAGRILSDAEAAIRAAYRRGRVPLYFDVDSAAVFAVQGRNDAALNALEEAFQRGWRQNSGAHLQNIADEPAFRTLHGEPRFKQLQTALAAHYARERRELEQLLRI